MQYFKLFYSWSTLQYSTLLKTHLQIFYKNFSSNFRQLILSILFWKLRETLNLLYIC